MNQEEKDPDWYWVEMMEGEVSPDFKPELEELLRSSPKAREKLRELEDVRGAIRLVDEKLAETSESYWDQLQYKIMAKVEEESKKNLRSTKKKSKKAVSSQTWLR